MANREPRVTSAQWLDRLADVLMYFGVLCLVFAAIAFTTALPPGLREIGEYCFLGWWIPLIGGYVLKRAIKLTSKASRA